MENKDIGTFSKKEIKKLEDEWYEGETCINRGGQANVSSMLGAANAIYASVVNACISWLAEVFTTEN